MSDIDLWNIDLLGTHLDLLDTDIPSKHFVCLQDVVKASSRHVFRTPSRHVVKTSWRRLHRNNFSSSKTSSRRLQDVFARCLQDIFETSWKTKNCYAEDVLKTSSRHILKTSWRRLQDQQMFAGLSESLVLKIEMLLEFENKTNFEIFGF